MEGTPADAYNGTCGSHGADKVRDLPLCLLPELWSRAAEVRVWIVGVAKLIQNHPFTSSLHEPELYMEYVSRPVPAGLACMNNTT